MIKIRVTKEMLGVMDGIEDGPGVDEKLARAVLDIVERDINEAAGEDGNTGHMILIPNGCVEVSD